MLKIAVLGNSANAELQKHDYGHIVVCPNIKKFQQMTRNICPDALLINGKKLLEPFLNQLSKIPLSHRPPVFFLGDKPDNYEEIINLAKQGVDYYYTKPLNVKKFIGKVQELCPEYRIKTGANNTLSSSTLMQKVHLFSMENHPLIIYGETGCGKNYLANRIHILSPQQNRPFTHMNCGAIPNHLFEAELFGTTKGAFTDSVNRPGFLESTRDGTLFLDEIGELPLYSQVKLLRLLEEKTYCKLGSTESLYFKGRIIMATHRNLKKMMKKKLFREDLYYRVNILPLSIPPLRKRKEELPQLANNILKKFGSSKKLSYNALLKLYSYKWPGNIRELQSVLLRANTMSSSKRWIESTDIFFY